MWYGTGNVAFEPEVYNVLKQEVLARRSVTVTVFPDEAVVNAYLHARAGEALPQW